MKKFRILCLLLCLIMALQTAVVPIYATESSAETTEASDPTDTTEETIEKDIYTIPENVSGDASVNHGSNTIDAQKPLADDPELLKTAKGAILFEMNTGTLLYAKNPDERLYPASLTKVMTCLLALEKGNLDTMVTVSETAISNLDPDGSSANLKAGEEITLQNLLYCLMVSSANDAAAVIAEHIGGSQEAFVDLMNRKAEALGCTGTHFANPHGLHDENHYTTARDLAKIMMAALEYSEFNKIYSTTYYSVPATNLSEARELYTTNYLIGNQRIDYYYDSRFIGGKTGFTTPAGRCLITTAEDEESDFCLLSVILGAEATIDSDGYTILRYGNFEETKDLVNFGFDSFTTVEVCTRGMTVDQFPVSGGENSISAEPGASCTVIVPADYQESKLCILTEVVDGGLTAPVNVGDTVGSLRVWYRDVCVAQTELLSLSASKKDTMNSVFSGGVLTEEEDKQITDSMGTIVKWFLILVGIVVVLALIVGVYNAVIEHKRRKRRRNRRRSR